MARAATKWRVLGLVLVTGLLVFLLAGVALAASPQDIYKDYVTNGKISGNYTQAELNAVLTDPTLAQYADQGQLEKLKDLIQTSNETRGTFPFTGSQMLLIFGAGIVLVGGGVVLRRGQRKGP